MASLFAKLLTNRRGYGAIIGITIPFALEVLKQTGTISADTDTTQAATLISSLGAGLLSLWSLLRPKAQ